MWSPRNDASMRQAGIVHRSSQSEIGYQRSLNPIFQKDVGWLDVAVNNSLFVRRCQSGCDLNSNPQNLFPFERSDTIDTGL